MPIAAARAEELLAQSKESHRGVFITGPQTLEMRDDTLPSHAFDGDGFVTASIGNCRCTSDAKAIKQFTEHARVPSGTEQIALGHETLQVILQAPETSDLQPGDLVVITPGHSNAPVDPQSFESDPDNGVLAALGYSYRYLGGLRPFNLTPAKAEDVVRDHGFGALFNKVPTNKTASIASLSHAEPFACNYGTNKHIFFEGAGGEFDYGVPARANIAYLGGTARMAMINLTIVASVPDDQLPAVISITGSQRKLDELAEFDLITVLKGKGVTVELIDRNAENIIERLTEHGKPHVIWTNFAAPEVYEQAVQSIALGGNINSYAGASDPSLTLTMPIAAAENPPSLADEALQQIAAMHHNCGPNDPQRFRGLAKQAAVRLIGFDDARRSAYLAAFPAGTQVSASDCDAADLPAGLESVADGPWTDVFIAGTGEAAARIYSEVELTLARSAAVNFVDGDTTIAIRSRHTHYTSRHQICGANIPWTMTNTSEPVAEDLARQASDPVDFDWMLTGICGLNHAIEMMETVEKAAPFGSFYVYNDLPDLPYVPTSAAAFRAQAAESSGTVVTALNAAAAVLEETNDAWCRAAEEALYAAYDVPFPLA